jgi:hypothetical protein
MGGGEHGLGLAAGFENIGIGLEAVGGRASTAVVWLTGDGS